MTTIAADAAQTIVRLKGEGYSANDIAGQLNLNGQTTTTGKAWSAANIRRVIPAAEALVAQIAQDLAEAEAYQAAKAQDDEPKQDNRKRVSPELVDHMKELYWTVGLSHGQIADYLNEQGTPTVTGRGTWGVGTVGRILRRNAVASRKGWGKGAQRKGE